ncbi:MAG: hypothetical protein GJV46_01495 [Geobacter sp.]|nr:hypothetical protein [Geobacter sp.]
MANTERLAVLQRVREAKKSAVEARSIQGLTKKQRDLLEELTVDLENQEDTLIMEAIDEKIDAMHTAGTRLEAVAQQIKKETAKLQEVADLVNKAAKAIQILADITAKVGTLGVL